VDKTSPCRTLLLTIIVSELNSAIRTTALRLLYCVMSNLRNCPSFLPSLRKRPRKRMVSKAAFGRDLRRKRQSDVSCLCGGCKMSPRTTSSCSYNISGLQGSWIVYCLHLKIELRSCTWGRQWYGIFHYNKWTASIKPKLLFSHARCASWGLSLSPV